MKQFPKVLFSSTKLDWSTPRGLAESLHDEFHFRLDVCANPETAIVPIYFAKGALSKRWHGTCFMNPPYGRNIGRWVEKAWRESRRGATVVCLLAARTDTKWFHQYCIHADEIRFIKGRLTFEGAKSNAPFPSMVVIFRNGRWRFMLKAKKFLLHLVGAGAFGAWYFLWSVLK